MFILKNEIQFDSAHYLSGYEWKCSNLHGHRYRLITKVESETLHEEGQLRGMVDDFGNIKKVLKKIEKQFDHKLIVEENDDGIAVAKQLEQLHNGFEILFVPYRPTAEEMARHIFYLIRGKGVHVTEVELFETPTNSCIYKEN